MIIQERRYYIDWLRIMAMAVFLFHCARFFDYGDWHMKNNRLDFGMAAFVRVVSGLCHYSSVSPGWHCATNDVHHENPV